MRALKDKFRKEEFKQGVAVLAIVGCVAGMYACTQVLQRDYWKMAKVTLNDRMQLSFREFSTALQNLVAAEAANEGRVSADSLNTLYRECKFLERENESDAAEHLYPAFHAQLGQALSTCTELAQVEQKTGLTSTHLAKAAKDYDQQLKATLQRVVPERAAWASKQMQSLAKD